MPNQSIFYFDPFRDGDYTLHPKIGYTVRKVLPAYYTQYYNTITDINLNGTVAVGITYNSNTGTNTRVWIDSLSHAFVNGALRNISGLGLITVPMDLTYTFSNCQNLTYIESLPPQTTYLNAAFRNCTNLTTIPSIPDSVKYMGGTFYECTNLAGNIYIYSNQVINADSCFNNTTLQKNVYIPFTYENGEYTKTYNSFTSLGYDTTGTLDGVYLKDIAHIPSGSGGTPDPTPNPNTTK
jgi:hypothetical protein